MKKNLTLANCNEVYVGEGQYAVRMRYCGGSIHEGFSWVEDDKGILHEVKTSTLTPAN